MANKSYRVDDEPVPGYRLREYLGRGGFGEVWRASGPGGVQMALKIINDLHRKKGGKELRALRRLKNIRHPNLVPLTGFWLKDNGGTLIDETTSRSGFESSWDENGEPALACGTLVPECESPQATMVLANEAVELVIAMGLCEQSLYDCLEDSRLQTGCGIPREDLLTYMDDAARAIDLLNARHGIQHCDIKPQNILLLSDAAQVCDFGLATSIGEVRESSMGAGTIAYGAPEVLLGKGPSPATDQYSLAISYVELLTGHLPYSSERISDVLQAKQHGKVDLCLLAPAERAVIARATSVEPGDRFSSCVAMVRSLRNARPGDAPLSIADTGDHGQSLVDTTDFSTDTRESGHVRASGTRPWLHIGALGIALLAIVTVLLTATSQFHPEPALQLVEGTRAPTGDSSPFMPDAVERGFPHDEHRPGGVPREGPQFRHVGDEPRMDPYEHEPFEVFSDPELERTHHGRRDLEQVSHTWIRYRERDGQLHAYFTPLVQHRYAIEAIHYGVNTHALNREFPLDPFDPHAPAEIPPGTPTHIVVPFDTAFVAVLVRYRDGTESPVETFENRFLEPYREWDRHRDEQPQLEPPAPRNGWPGRRPSNWPPSRNRRLPPWPNGPRLPGATESELRREPDFQRPTRRPPLQPVHTGPTERRTPGR